MLYLGKSGKLLIKSESQVLTYAIVNFSIKFTQKPKKKKHVTLNCELAGFFFFLAK